MSKNKRDKFNILNFFSEYQAVHDLEDTFSSLDLLGKKHYSTRSLQMPYKNVFIQDEYKPVVEKLWHYYKSIGIGPRNITYVDGKNLLRSSLDVVKSSKDKVKLSLFGISDKTGSTVSEILNNEPTLFIKKLKKIPTKVVKISEKMNSKYELRKFIHSNGKYKIFDLPHQIEVKDKEKDELNFTNLLRMIGGNSRVIIKPLKSTGGDGVLITKDYKEVLNFKKNYRSKYKDFQDEFLYEEFKEIKKEASAQFMVLKRKGEEREVEFLSLTRQIINKVYHEGNVLSNDPKSKINTLLNKKLINLLSNLVLDFSNENDYKGYVGVDFGITREGELVIFEFNARITGSTYPLLVLKQLETLGLKKFYIASSNAIKPSRRSLNFDDLMQILRDNNLAFDLKKKRGLIPTLVTTLPTKVGFLSVGGSEKKALEYINQIDVLVNKTNA